jgi:4-amino-4-deoxy-L-arabinose transferase-like glycosyltransferase
MKLRTIFSPTTIALILIVGLGFALRLVVWRWREFYPLGGDEQEYLNTALTILRERRYQELLFMRPPLYPIFLAAAIYLFDSLIQNLRLVQALLSTATIPFIYLLTSEIARTSGSRAAVTPARLSAIIAATFAALSYTLAANATELLSETLFLFGLTVTLWLLLRAGRVGGWRAAALAGLALGTLCLVRSVALPLLPLGALWLWFRWHQAKAIATEPGQRAGFLRANASALLFVLATVLVVAPWTARNYLTYGGLILIDTTGAENLWLDNDPAGREAVKAQLFALGDDRLARQRLATQQGLAAITADPQRFAAKAWGELTKLFALEYSDDMRARPVIWLPPVEVWLRLLLGDGLWLLILLLGTYGLALSLSKGHSSLVTRHSSLLTLFALYIVATAMLFHVELRYRLPLYPVLLPYAAIVLGRRTAKGAEGGESQGTETAPFPFVASASFRALRGCSYAVARQLPCPGLATGAKTPRPRQRRGCAEPRRCCRGRGRRPRCSRQRRYIGARTGGPGPRCTAA